MVINALLRNITPHIPVIIYVQVIQNEPSAISSTMTLKREKGGHTPCVIDDTHRTTQPEVFRFGLVECIQTFKKSYFNTTMYIYHTVPHTVFLNSLMVLPLHREERSLVALVQCVCSNLPKSCSPIRSHVIN